jgi:hypothetical protein
MDVLAQAATLITTMWDNLGSVRILARATTVLSCVSVVFLRPSNEMSGQLSFTTSIE